MFKLFHNAVEKPVHHHETLFPYHSPLLKVLHGMDQYLNDKGFAVLTALDAVAGRHDATPAQAAARMQISEIWYNSPGSDRGGNASLNHEWVQLHNTSGSWITMTGWTLRDPAHHVYTFGTYKIKPHGYVKIHTGQGTSTQTNRYWGSGWYIWNNDGDSATLRNASGVVKSGCSYSDPNAIHAFKIC